MMLYTTESIATPETVFCTTLFAKPSVIPMFLCTYIWIFTPLALTSLGPKLLQQVFFIYVRFWYYYMKWFAFSYRVCRVDIVSRDTYQLYMVMNLICLFELMYTFYCCICE